MKSFTQHVESVHCTSVHTSARSAIPGPFDHLTLLDHHRRYWT